MPDNSQNTSKIQVLTDIRQVLEALGLETNIQEEASSQNPVLLAGLTKDKKGRDRILTLNFLPFEADNDFDFLSMIQSYINIPISLENSVRPQVVELLVQLNNHLAIGYFGISTEGNLYHRHILTTEKWASPDPESLTQIFLIIFHTLQVFSPLIEAVATKEKSIEAVLEML